MKSIIATCFLLAAAKSVYSDEEGWRRNARGFEAEVRKEIREIYERKSPLCSEMIEHVIAYEKREIINQFNACDSSSSSENCYFRCEENFHQKVLKTKEPDFCEIDKVCSFWNSEILHKRLFGGCFYFRSPETVIDIWSRCSFLKPVLDISHEISRTIANETDICINSALNMMVYAVRKAWQEYDACKKENLHDIARNFDAFDDNCYLEKNILREKYWNVTRCWDGPLRTFHLYTGDLEKVKEKCNLSSTAASSAL